MRTRLLALAAVAVLPAWAHHAFGGEFDPNRPVLLKGKVTKVEWVNPHAWIHVEVTKPDGSKEEWMVEGGSPNSLLRRGLTRDSLPVGTEVVVDGYQARDHNLLRANGRNVTLTDGRKLFLGSSGPGEPPKDAVPTEQAKPPESK
ncbi:MAG: hypothetical protein JO307_06820 [Bryobacterales bacterium]|nr:hypothetical protein [Bryobacterales bacterium]MBV9399579.1 hypothetical protein [Bryobacterales bacterium]